MSEEIEVTGESTIEPAETTQETETPAAETAEITADAAPDAETKEERLFKQAEVDSIIQKRLDRERAKIMREDPALSYVGKLAQKNNMTVEQFVAACEEADKQAQISELAQTGQIPDEIAQELYESRREKQARAQMQQRLAPVNELLQYYPDLKPEDIPESVWRETVSNGKSLAAAYAKYDSDRKAAEIAKLKESIQIRGNNADNADVSPGGVTGGGSPSDAGFISAETFEQNKNDQRWIIKNLSKIQDSRKKWL